MTTISHDLIRDIIQYIPVWDLRRLSRASPIFDIEIHALGIRLFYDEKYYSDLSTTEKVVIETSTGKKFVLKILDDCAIEIFTGRKIKYKEIIWTDNAQNNLLWNHDRRTDYLMYGTPYFAVFSKKIGNNDNIKLSYRFVDIKMGLKCLPRYIDMTNGMIYSTYGRGQHNIMFDCFRVIFADGKFVWS